MQIGSQNPIEKSFLMFIEVTNLKWIPLGGGIYEHAGLKYFQTVLMYCAQRRNKAEKKC